MFRECYTVNAKISVVTLSRGGNFTGIIFVGEGSPPLIAVTNSLSLQIFVGLIFVGVICHQKLIPNDNFYVYGIGAYCTCTCIVQPRLSELHVAGTRQRRFG